MQHKGDSECYYGPDFGADELCNFEKLPYSNFFEKYIPLLREPPGFTLIDDNGDGHIDFQEFLAWWREEEWEG